MWKIEVLVDGIWRPIGGKFANKEQARQKIAEYLVAAVRQRTPSYRVVWA